ncbi:TPA: hypothetical protein HA246_06450 [Candidatus Woesearchaeota archaeon]|nr:hypothetical protein [Candidatus Woesearchaeota archaeon]
MVALDTGHSWSEFIKADTCPIVMVLKIKSKNERKNQKNNEPDSRSGELSKQNIE